MFDISGSGYGQISAPGPGNSGSSATFYSILYNMSFLADLKETDLKINDKQIKQLTEFTCKLAIKGSYFWK